MPEFRGAVEWTDDCHEGDDIDQGPRLQSSSCAEVRASSWLNHVINPAMKQGLGTPADWCQCPGHNSGGDGHSTGP